MQLDDVVLDEPAFDDVASLHGIYSDPRVWTHYPSRRHTDVGTTEAMVRRWIIEWQRDALSTWVIRDARDSAVLGHAGCSVRQSCFWNLGYRLAPHAHGRGLATRVSRRAMIEARRIRPELPIVAYLVEHNVASARVAGKVGLTLQHHGPDVGNPDPTAVRLVYADRSLPAEVLRAVVDAPG